MVRDVFDHDAPIDTELRRFAGTMASRLTHGPTIARLRPVIAEVVMKPTIAAPLYAELNSLGLGISAIIFRPR